MGRTGVTGEVFTSAASIAFDPAENRLHAIKAVLVATLWAEHVRAAGTLIPGSWPDVRLAQSIGVSLSIAASPAALGQLGAQFAGTALSASSAG